VWGGTECGARKDVAWQADSGSQCKYGLMARSDPPHHDEECAMTALLVNYQDPGPEMLMLRWSVGSIAMFNGRRRLTSRQTHFKHRTSVTHEPRQTWLITIRDFLQIVSWNRIVNYDGTSWLLQQNGVLA
jgi:hypothetical protein